MLKYRLRTLFILISVSALAVWLVMWWRQRYFAEVSWLSGSSPDAALLRSGPLIEQHGWEFSATFHPGRRDVYELLRVLQIRRDEHLDVRVPVLNGLYQYIKVSSPDKGELAAAIVHLQQADVLKAGDIVINGVVRSRDGKPVADAIIDLIGPMPEINECRSREDGTFAMPMPSRVGKYYLRIRYGAGREARTAAFSLDNSLRERSASIRVP